MTYETLEFEIENGVARVVLNRPQMLNAMDLAMMKDLMHGNKRLPPKVCFDAPTPPKPGQHACPLASLREHARKVGGISDSDKEDTQIKALQRAIKKLQHLGIIHVYEDWAWLGDKGDI